LLCLTANVNNLFTLQIYTQRDVVYQNKEQTIMTTWRARELERRERHQSSVQWFSLVTFPTVGVGVV